jgi:hypothetical protein
MMIESQSECKQRGFVKTILAAIHKTACKYIQPIQQVTFYKLLKTIPEADNIMYTMVMDNSAG